MLMGFIVCFLYFACCSLVVMCSRCSVSKCLSGFSWKHLTPATIRFLVQNVSFRAIFRDFLGSNSWLSFVTEAGLKFSSSRFTSVFWSCCYAALRCLQGVLWISLSSILKDHPFRWVLNGVIQRMWAFISLWPSSDSIESFRFEFVCALRSYVCGRVPLHSPPRASSKNFHGYSKISSSGSVLPVRAFARFCVWFVCCCRIGEATVPGPGDSFVIGVCNPSGLPSKAFTFNSYHADLWLVTETHLTRPGLRTFRRALASFQSPYKWMVHGNEVQHRSQVSDVGKWSSGVAAISKWPTRRLQHDWDPGMHSTGRLVASTSCIGELWISGVTVYGTPVGPTHPGAREKTEALLYAATKRAVQAVGCRFVAGDFNCDHDSSPALAQLRNLGFQDVQDLQFRCSGRLPQPTCRGRTRRDFLFVSPELASRFIQCTVDPMLWPDHAAVLGEFQAQMSCNLRFTWPIPQPLDWDLLPSDHTGAFVSFDGCQDCTSTYAHLWSQKEHDVACVASSKGWSISPFCFGRATQTAPRRSNAACPPVKTGRHGDLQPSFLGFSMLHLKWFRQCRRLHCYVRLVEHEPLSPSQCEHRDRLWISICKASGFSPSFVDWWQRKAHCVGEVQALPAFPPNFPTASLIFQAFEHEVRVLEKSLGKHRNYVAKLRGASSINQLFRSVKRDQPEQVDVLIQDVQASVHAICQDDCSVSFNHEIPWKPDAPFFHNGRQLSICHAEPDQLWLESISDIQVGDPIVQPRRVGNLDDLFNAFREQWNSRWNKHTAVPNDRWRVIVDFARTYIEPAEHPKLNITPVLLRAIIKSKKKSSATGLDGVSRSDLMASSTNDLLSFISLFSEAEKSGRWPEQMLAGTVRSLAKCREPATPNHFRPITVFSLVYRLWSSSQSRYWLSKLESQLDPWLFGNRSHRRAADMWRIILDVVEDHQMSSTCISGLVLDLEKAFNTLPRYPTMATALALGIHESTLRAWSGAVTNMARHFCVQDSLSEALFSNCGFAEGCGMSCVAMLAIDHLYHLWTQKSCSRTKALSFVDNWELVVADATLVSDSFHRVLEFAELLDLSIDQGKTFAWSTTSFGRATLKQDGFLVKHDGRDLGAHISYSKQIRNSTIQQKILDLHDFWEKLFHCRGSHHQKCRLVVACAWPRALHAISGCFLGKKHWVALRTRVIRSLRLDVAGANPLLQLHAEPFGLDPLVFAILSTIRDFREFGVTEEHFVRLSQINQGCGEPGFQSVTEVLTSRIHTLGWNWTLSGEVEDSIGAFSLAHAGMAEVLFRLRRSWHFKIASDLKQRTGFADFDKVDPQATCQALADLTPFDRASLRVYLSGATFTNAQAFKWTTSGSTLCAACGCSQDCAYHRLWECPSVADLRAAIDLDILDAIPRLPSALSVHGWTLASPVHGAWLNYLDNLPRYMPVPLVPLNAPCVDLFTDGSCFWNRTSYAVASWSVILGSSPSLVPDPSAFQIVAADALPGIIQSAYRAELYALLAAATYVQQFAVVGRVWTDCQSLVTTFRLFVSGVKRPKPNNPHIDLWNRLLQIVRELPSEALMVAKVPAHQTLTDIENDIEAWAVLGNTAADSAAKSANLARDSTVWDLWSAHSQHVTRLSYIGKVVRNFMVQVSTRWLQRQFTSKDGLEPRQPESRPGRVFPVQWEQTGPVQQIGGVFHRRFGFLETNFLQWWNVNTCCSNSPRWISFMHLYLDWQMTYGHPGVLLIDGQWYDASSAGLTPESYHHNVRTKWWRLLMQQFFRDAGIQVGRATLPPYSSVVYQFVGAASIPWPSHRIERIDNWISERLQGRRGNGSVFKSLPLCSASLGFDV